MLCVVLYVTAGRPLTKTLSLLGEVVHVDLREVPDRVGVFALLLVLPVLFVLLRVFAELHHDSEREPLHARPVLVQSLEQLQRLGPAQPLLSEGVAHPVLAVLLGVVLDSPRRLLQQDVSPILRDVVVAGVHLLPRVVRDVVALRVQTHLLGFFVQVVLEQFGLAHVSVQPGKPQLKRFCANAHVGPVGAPVLRVDAAQPLIQQFALHFGAEAALRQPRL